MATRTGYDYVLDASNRLVNEDLNRFVTRTQAQLTAGQGVGVDTSVLDTSVSPSVPSVTLLQYNDTFSGTHIDCDRWRMVYANPTSGTTVNYVGFEIRQQTGLQLVFPRGFGNRIAFFDQFQYDSTGTFQTTPPYPPTGQTYTNVFGGVEHRTSFVGTGGSTSFTVQVDFSAFQGLLASSNLVNLGLMVADTPLEHAISSPTNAVELHIDNSSQYYGVVTTGGTSAGTVSASTTDVSGGLQIVCTSGQIKFYRRVSGTWTQIGTGSIAFSTTNTLYVSLFLRCNRLGIGTGVFTNFTGSFNSYPSSGTYTSAVYDAGQSVTWNSIAWQGNFPTGTAVTYQIAVGDPTAGWTYVGYDGTDRDGVRQHAQCVYDTPERALLQLASHSHRDRVQYPEFRPGGRAVYWDQHFGDQDVWVRWGRQHDQQGHGGAGEHDRDGDPHGEQPQPDYRQLGGRGHHVQRSVRL